MTSTLPFVSAATASQSPGRSSSFNRQHGWSHAHAEAYTLYGRFLRQHGRSEAALDAFERATDLAPSIQAAFGHTGLVAARQGFDLVVDAGQSGGAANFVLGRAGAAVGDVLRDRH